MVLNIPTCVKICKLYWLNTSVKRSKSSVPFSFRALKSGLLSSFFSEKSDDEKGRERGEDAGEDGNRTPRTVERLEAT